jgi:hypothetical protein
MAISCVHVDGDVPKDTMDALRGLPNIVTAQLVKL